MKKSFFILITFILLLHSSCNQKEDKKDNKPIEVIQSKDTTKNAKALTAICSNCNTANLEIPETTARNMIRNFETAYLKDADDITTIPKRVWIDACYVSTLLSYINSTPAAKIDGIRFYWGANKSRNDKVQLFVTPTTNRKPLWPNNINTQTCGPQFINYDNDFTGIADPMLKRYNKIQRKTNLFGVTKRDNLSKGVWFSTCVLECITKTIEANSENKFNGVFIYNAAYSEISGKVPGQEYPNQSTLVIVFSKLDYKGNTVEDFTVGEALFKNANKDWKDALNHGELCPSRCGE